LTVRPIGPTETKVGHNEPVSLCGKDIAQQIKSTQGITGLCLPRVLIDEGVWHLDVDSSYPGAAKGSKG